MVSRDAEHRNPGSSVQCSTHATRRAFFAALATVVPALALAPTTTRYELAADEARVIDLLRRGDREAVFALAEALHDRGAFASQEVSL